MLKIDTMESLLPSQTLLSARKKDSTVHSYTSIIAKCLLGAATMKDAPCLFHDG